MTVSSDLSKLSYNGDGTSTPRATPQFVSNSDIIAILRSASDVETIWVEDTDYTLTGAGVASGGTLTPIATPPAVGEKLIIFRDPPIVQNSEYPIGGPLPSKVIEANVDGLTFMAQRLSERVDRTFVFPESDTGLNTALPVSTARANAFLGFDGSGNPIAAAGTSANLGPVSAYMDTLLDDGTAAAARTTLEAQEDVVTTRGDIVAGDSGGAASRLALGASGQRLESDGTDAVWTTPPVVAMPRGHLWGLNLSNNATDATDSIDIALGECRSDSDDGNVTLPSAVGKDLSVSWAAGGTPGTPTGGLSSSLTLTNDTTYHAIAGNVGGTGEIGFDTSITGANLVTDHSFTNTRCIGSVNRLTAINQVFFQIDDDFMIEATLGFQDTTPAVTAETQTLAGVPTGRKVRAKISAALNDTSTGASVFGLASSLDVPDVAPSASSHNYAESLGTATALRSSSTLDIWTNTSAQIRTRHSNAPGGVTLDMSVHGWMDRRGRGG